VNLPVSKSKTPSSLVYRKYKNVLTKIQTLIEALNTTGIRYCHWKSNLALPESLEGLTDIDLLIDRQHANLFRTILSQLCFQPTIVNGVEPFPSVEHYFAVDDESGRLIHVHAYFRVISGESLTKNYRFPIEEMLLQNTREVNSVQVPIKSAELVVFTLRIMLKHTSLLELILVARYWKQVEREIAWLLEDASIDETLRFVKCWLPSLDPDFFAECIAALKAPAPLLRRIMLGHQLRGQLSLYNRHSIIRAWLGGIKKFSLMFYRRLTRSKLGMVPQSGGVVIAFVGSEATGKSTLLAEMKGWLGEHFTVDQIHAGKPKPTLLSAGPNLLVPALRSLLPTQRSTRIEEQYVAKPPSEKSQKNVPLMFAIRAALLAYDRRSLLTRAYSQAANGTIVLCDRYPSLQSGAPDSPQLSHLPASSNGSSMRRMLARIEARWYREIPPPDLVIYLSAPLEVTVSRNATRGKVEPEDYVRWRHARSSSLEFGKTPVYKINTDQPFDQTVLEVKKAIWNAL
jgi:thymidylate kinase